MSMQKNRRISPRPIIGSILVAASVVFTVAVSVLFLGLHGANHTASTTSTTHTPSVSPYLPTIQTPGAGVAHIVVDPRTGQAHGTVTPPAARASQASGPCREICATAHQSPDNTINATPGNPDVSNVGRRADQ